MAILINTRIPKLHPIHPIDTRKPSLFELPKSFDSIIFCQYHHQPSHDIRKCHALKNDIQDLIDSNAISIDVEVNSMNKYVASPN